jgi:hypothetical protein
MMNAGQMITKLTYAEVDSNLAADAQRMMRDERFALSAAVESKDGDKIAAAMEEAKRVAAMWGVSL